MALVQSKRTLMDAIVPVLCRSKAVSQKTEADPLSVAYRFLSVVLNGRVWLHAKQTAQLFSEHGREGLGLSRGRTQDEASASR